MTGTHQDGQVCRQMAKLMLKSGLSNRWCVQLPYGIDDIDLQAEAAPETDQVILRCGKRPGQQGRRLMRRTRANNVVDIPVVMQMKVSTTQEEVTAGPVLRQVCRVHCSEPRYSDGWTA